MPRADDQAEPVLLPLDPDLEPRLRPRVIAAVFAGGCIGGYARYAVTTAWRAPNATFPMSTFVVNVVGAFVLALIVVVASALRRSPYLRPLIGTGFCGAFTTFSSVTVTADQLFAHDHWATAVAYLCATIAAGLAAATAGLVVGRTLTRHRRSEPRR